MLRQRQVQTPETYPFIGQPGNWGIPEPHTPQERAIAQTAIILAGRFNDTESSPEMLWFRINHDFINSNRHPYYYLSDSEKLELEFAKELVAELEMTMALFDGEASVMDEHDALAAVPTYLAKLNSLH